MQKKNKFYITTGVVLMILGLLIIPSALLENDFESLMMKTSSDLIILVLILFFSFFILFFLGRFIFLIGSNYEKYPNANNHCLYFIWSSPIIAFLPIFLVSCFRSSETTGYGGSEYIIILTGPLGGVIFFVGTLLLLFKTSKVVCKINKIGSILLMSAGIISGIFAILFLITLGPGTDFILTIVLGIILFVPGCYLYKKIQV